MVSLLFTSIGWFTGTLPIMIILIHLFMRKQSKQVVRYMDKSDKRERTKEIMKDASHRFRITRLFARSLSIITTILIITSLFIIGYVLLKEPSENGAMALPAIALLALIIGPAIALPFINQHARTLKRFLNQADDEHVEKIKRANKRTGFIIMGLALLAFLFAIGGIVAMVFM